MSRGSDDRETFQLLHQRALDLPPFCYEPVDASSPTELFATEPPFALALSSAPSLPLVSCELLPDSEGAPAATVSMCSRVCGRGENKRGRSLGFPGGGSVKGMSGSGGCRCGCVTLRTRRGTLVPNGERLEVQRKGRDEACKGSVAKKEEAKLSAWAGVCWEIDICWIGGG
jgi:hypothetical protein